MTKNKGYPEHDESLIASECQRIENFLVDLCLNSTARADIVLTKINGNRERGEPLIASDVIENQFSLITETWLKESVPDSVINIPGFTLLRRDRSSQIHGGIGAYIKETHYKYERLDDLNCCDDHECLWIYLRPTRLPRGLTCIITSVITHPPGACRRSAVAGPSFSYAYFSRIKIFKLWNHCDRRF